LEAKKYRLYGKAAFARQDSYVGWIVTRDIVAFGSDNYRDNLGQSVNRIYGEDENGTLPRLFSSLNRIQIDKINFAPLDRH